MSLYRSAQMKYYELYIPKEDAYKVVSKLAEHSFVQFLDASSNSFHKPYYNSIRRCEEVISKVDIIVKEIHRQGIDLPEIPVVDKVLKKHYEMVGAKEQTEMEVLDGIQDQIDKKYLNVDKLTKSHAEFDSKLMELEDYKYLLFKARQVFASKANDPEVDLDFSKTSLQALRLLNVSGVLKSKDMLKFSRMIFRATKGNSILYTFNIPSDNEKEEARTAFIAIVESGSNIVSKVSKICEGFNVKKYCLPTNKDQIFEKIREIEDAITDTKQLSVMTAKKIQEDLMSTITTGEYGYSRFEAFRIILEKQCILYNTLNLFEEKYGNTVVGKIWIPLEKRGLLFKVIPSIVTIREPETHAQPPTHFETNEFTAPFQSIIDTYGTPRYQEINPALFAINIFPFLFGVMFGDIGHGGILLCFGLWLVHGASAKHVIPDLYAIRYLVLFMGIFSFYSGWIYNEFFSIPLNVFGSCYDHPEPQEFATKIDGCVYPFGFDPKWIRSSNELNYFNSYKMKFAVIIGVIQMSFGIYLKMLNTVHFKNYVDCFFEWLPQQIFFACTFGYMCILIIYKWTIAWGIDRDTSAAPSIIAQMIALPLLVGSTEGKPLWDMESQEALQYNLLLIALICVPWMLIPKPLILWCQMKKSAPAHHAPVHEESFEEPFNEDMEADLVPPKKIVAIDTTRQETKEHGAHEEHDISEIAVHQIIETIEFVLGSISNTASYLRLWALSLAHGQLSKVFFEKTVGGGVQSANTIVIVIGMYFFFNITLGIIMCMDSMECFLHALRLQWVEFDSKFFKADGWRFEPLTLESPIQLKAIALRDLQ